MAYTLTYTLNSDGNSYTLSGFSGEPTGELVIPDSYDSKPVTSIGNTAFRNCRGLTSVTIGNSVTSIGSEAFEYCSGLTSVTIGNGVTSIGERAFRDCSGLTSVTMGNNVTSVGNEAFYRCRGLTSITIPNSVTNIGASAFYDCDGLTSVTIGNSVTSIGSSAFYGCTGLTSITIPNSVMSIGGSAFNGCSGLTSVTIGSGVTSIGKSVFYKCTGLTSITIPDNVTSIENSAFYGCGLTSITIPNRVTSIGNSAFAACANLTSITVSTGNSVYHSAGNCIIETETKTIIAGCKTSVIPAGVTSIGENAFRDCSGLTSITIPDSVTSIGNYAFRNCRGLTSVTIPDSVTSISGDAFNGCSGLTSVTIGNGVTSIGYNAFFNCSGLTSIMIPSSVTSIGSHAFYNCTGLTSVTIGTSVISIDSYTFRGCSSLTKINMLSTTPPTIHSSTLVTTIQNIYVPSQSAETYKSATNWNAYADKIIEFPLLDLGSLLLYNNKVKAKIDADSNKNEDTYAKQNGSYSNLTAGKANIHTSIQLANNADLNTYYGESYWGRLYYAAGNNSIVNRPIESDNNGFSLEILRGGAGGTIQRCTIYAAGGSAIQPVVFTRWHLGTAWKEWQETAEAIGTYPNMTVGKATNLTDPFIIGSDTNTAQTWVTKFATITLKTAWVSSATRFEIVDTNYTNNTTQPVGVEISVSPTTSALTVRAYALYGNPQILNNIYISHSVLGTFPMTVDLYYSIENTAYTTIGIKPLWQSHRNANSSIEFITTNTNVSALPTDRTNIRLTQLPNYAVITRAGYDGDGNNIANTYAKKAEISNPNLLINPDFSINQRGQESYNTQKQYTCDRWVLCSANGTTYNASTKTLTVASGGYFWYEQYSEIDAVLLRGKSLTFTLSASGSTRRRISFGYKVDSTKTEIVGKDTTEASTKISVTGTVPNDATGIIYVRIQGFDTTGTITLEWAKLEVGSVATAFNPPLIVAELPKCQRYYTKIDTSDNPNKYQICQLAKTNYAMYNAQIFFPVRMRTPPTTVALFSSETNTKGYLYNNTKTVDQQFSTGYITTDGFQFGNKNGDMAADDIITGYYEADAEIY